jgi:hypothetical protein
MLGNSLHGFCLVILGEFVGCKYSQVEAKCQGKFFKRVINFNNSIGIMVKYRSNTIAHSDIATVTVKAMSKENEQITLPNETLLNLSPETAGSLHGSLLNPATNTVAKALENIVWLHAKTGAVKYIADGATPNRANNATLVGKLHA